MNGSQERNALVNNSNQIRDHVKLFCATQFYSDERMYATFIGYRHSRAAFAFVMAAL
jgi:hypothetical protein